MTQASLRLDGASYRGDVPPAERVYTPRLAFEPGTEYRRAILYVAYCKGFAKIGISGESRTRIRSMQTGCPFPIHLIFTFPLHFKYAGKAEMETMRLLNDFHWRHDWFKCSRGAAILAAERITARYPSRRGNKSPPYEIPLAMSAIPDI